MKSSKEAKQLKINRIKDRVQIVADKLFSGDLDIAFLYWAANLHLDQADNPPTEDELVENISDGKDDLSIDAFFIDEDARTVYLLQSKYRSNPGSIPPVEFSRFLDAPANLTSPQVLASNTNQKILEFATMFREKLLEGYQLQLVFLATLSSNSQVQGRAQKWNEDTLTLTIGGEPRDVPHSVTVSDLDDLVARVDSSSSQEPVDLTLKLIPGSFYQAKAAGFGYLVGSVDAQELAQVFDRWRFAMFRYNPRGPLGAVRANKDIKATLQDANKRIHFHLLNNGLSAVCENFTPPQNGEVAVKDLQIVNGCQTTYNIWDHWRRNGSLKGVQVVLKLVDAQALRTIISEASNTQSPMKDWDFLFNDPLQSRLQKEFSQMARPIFYELRRGEYKYMESEKNVERVTIKELSQAAWAFLGSPGEAKDKLRDIPRSRGSSSGVYHDVFPQNITAMQLLLPWRIYDRVKQEYQKHYEQVETRGDFREYGRLHIVWLIGRALARGLKKGRPEFTAPEAEQLLETLDEWFDRLHDVAIETIKYVTNVQKGIAEQTGQPLSLRQLFRSPVFDEKGKDVKGFTDAQNDRLTADVLLLVKKAVSSRRGE